MVRYAEHDWFYSLNKIESKNGLLDRYSRSELNSLFTVCATKIDGGRLFGVFDSFIDYLLFVKKIEPKHRCYYEVLFGEFPCKPHFDIDIDKKNDIDIIYSENCITNIIDAICYTFKQKFQINLDIEKDIRIYSSHGINKFSYHIVVNNYYHTNANQSKAFFYSVIEKVDKKYVKHMDDSVYSSTQQFRLLGCRKLNSDRIKTFETSWVYNNRKINCKYSEEIESADHLEVVQMQESLVGYIIGCNCLPDIVDYNPSKHNVSEVNDIMVEKALKLCSENFGFTWNTPESPYAFRSVQNGYILLQRLKPSYCNICSVSHEHENPYLIVTDNCVFFSCRRKKEHREFLGYIKEDSPSITEKSKETVNIFESIDNCAKMSNDTIKGNPRKIKHTDDIDQKTLDSINELLSKSYLDTMVKNSWSNLNKKNGSNNYY